MAAWKENPFTGGAVNVGSSNSQDLFHGYGTEFNNTDRFILDISDVIHMLGADQTKLISWMQAAGTQPTTQVSFTHMESELFTVRDFSAKLIKKDGSGSDAVWMLKLNSPQDWQAIEVAAKGDGAWTDVKLPQIYMTVSDGTNSFDVVINKEALFGASDRKILTHAGGATGAIGLVKDAVVIASTANDANNTGTVIGGSSDTTEHGGGEVGDVPTAMNNLDITDWNSATPYDVTVHVTTPEEHLKGMPQGSGLPNETRKRSRSLRNFVQIFKTPWSITNTLKAVSMRGGDEVAMLRYRKTIQHKTALERAMFFQGGGIEGEDYGILNSGDEENPVTVFKGMGVGIAETYGLTRGSSELREKAGWITTKNADLNSDFEVDRTLMTDVGYFTDLVAKIFDDLVDDPSETKILACSNGWLSAIAKAAGHMVSGGFVLGDHTTKNVLGIPGIRTLTGPQGTLRMVPFKQFRGRYADYACVLDMNNIKYRPLRATKMLSDVGERTVDGQLDYMITEAGLQVKHESTHAVLRLVN